MSNLVAGQEALSRGSWAEALGFFDGEAEDPTALEAIGLAQWWLDEADATIAARERAYRIYRDQGNCAGAARVAGALASDSMLFGGRAHVARGWLDRARSVLEDVEVGDEHAWLEVREAEVALTSGLPAVAKEHARKAAAIAVEVEREDIEVVARSIEGLCLVHEGGVEEGMRHLNEAAVAAKAGDLGDLMWVGKVWCNMIGACERVGDVDRATEWCEEAREFAERWHLHTLFNVCRLQYAAVLIHSGDYDQAETLLESALMVLRGGRRMALHDATARLGEIRRRQGRLDEARAFYMEAERSRLARLGFVELALDEGDAETAYALATRLERTTKPGRNLDRIANLVLIVRSAVAAGRAEDASRAWEELEEIAARANTQGALAAAAHAGGSVAAAEGRHDDAERHYEDAAELFGASGFPFERAHSRLALAQTLTEQGQMLRGALEAKAARDAFADMGAAHGLKLADDVIARAAPGSAGDGSLTRRELEVLAHVAAGRSNPEIAASLVLSKHTVHRHVANILRKLGEPTRAAAASRATRDGLV